MNDNAASDRTEKLLAVLIVSLLIAMAIAGAAYDGLSTTFAGLTRLQLHSARLLSDFSAIVGDGAAVVNAVLVALIGMALVLINKVRVAGPTVAAVFTLFGFGLFGKTPFNTIPIIIGVAIAARLAGKRFREYIIIALFGTALGPVVSAVAVEVWSVPAVALPAAILLGVLVGVVLPPTAIAMLRVHQGYSLYNIGLTSGFVGIFIAAAFLSGDVGLPSLAAWNTNPGPVLRFLVPVSSTIFIICAGAAGTRSLPAEYRTLLRIPGRLPSDFIDMAGVAASLFNMGVMGLLCWGYLVAVGAPLNGPVLGGVFTVVGFAAFGKHPANAIPVMAGIAVATLVFAKGLASPGPVLAILFGTTLAPLAGSFGPMVGFLAGFVHLTMVLQTGAWHLGLTLYNNGFAGGLTAGLFVALIEWWTSEHETPRRFGARRSNR